MCVDERAPAQGGEARPLARVALEALALVMPAVSVDVQRGPVSLPREVESHDVPVGVMDLVAESRGRQPGLSERASHAGLERRVGEVRGAEGEEVSQRGDPVWDGAREEGDGVRQSAVEGAVLAWGGVEGELERFLTQGRGEVDEGPRERSDSEATAPHDGDVEARAVDAEVVVGEVPVPSHGEVDGAGRAFTEAVEPEEVGGGVVGQGTARSSQQRGPERILGPADGSACEAEHLAHQADPFAPADAPRDGRVRQPD